MPSTSTTLKAYKGQDTRDLLNHIAWTDVIKPKLDEAKSSLTKVLVQLTLSAPIPNMESKEQIAGKLYGLDYIEKVISRILQEGDNAKAALESENFFLQ